MGTSNWAPLDLNAKAPDRSTVVSWSTVIQHLLCALVVLQMPGARQATIADALIWTNEAREQSSGSAADEGRGRCCRPGTSSRLTAWQIAPGGEEHCPVITLVGAASL